MVGEMNKSHRAKALSNQQKQPGHPLRQQRTQERRPNDHGGFDGSILGTNCRFKLANGETLQGLVSAVSKYWYLINVDGQIMIVNKAYVVSIMPVQNQNKKDDAGTLVGTSVSPYGEKKA